MDQGRPGERGRPSMSELDPRFRIRAPLRCDGIGRLDCAEDTESGHRLAVRWLPLDANGDAAVKACERLPQHPTLPRIRQTGQVGASAFVALDFPEGQLLSAHLGEGLAVSAVLRMAGQLADALATVHAQGVVHGEMSAESVLLVPAGKAFLWDMPLVIANRLTDRRGESRLMQNLTKVAPYLAPERARGEAASPAADVYALGALVCAAAGAPSLSAGTTLEVVHQVGSGGWKPEVPAALPEPWRGVVTRMVAADASVRPGAAEVAKAFADAAAGAPFTTEPELPALQLPLAMEAAGALSGTPTREMPAIQLEAVLAASIGAPRKTLEMPLPAAAALTEACATPEAPRAPVPVETAPTATPATAVDDDVPEATADAVRIPTVEIPAASAAPSVALTDTISVAADLAPLPAQEQAISREELVAMGHAPHRNLWVLGGAGGVVGVALLVGLVLATQPVRQVEPAPAPTPAVAPAPVATPAPVVEAAADDELTPLPRLARPVAVPAPVPSARRVETSAAPSPAPAPASTEESAEAAPQLEAKAAAVHPTAPVATEAPLADDVGLPERAPALKSELKRPEL